MKKFIIISIILLPFQLFSQSNLILKNYNSANLPYLEAEFKASYNNSNVELSSENLLIREGGIAHKNYEISEADNNGWQKVTWVPDHNNIGEKLESDFIFTYEKSTAIETIEDGSIDGNYAGIIFLDNFGNRTEVVNFPNTEPGDSRLQPLTLNYFKNKLGSTNEILPVRIDSITISSDNFEYEWIGNQRTKQPPPVDIVSSRTLMLIRFYPETSESISAVLKVHYDGGAVAYIGITANRKKIEPTTNLQMDFPNGGEYFTPCQDTIANWSGNVKELETRLELSYDNGDTWEEVKSVIDSEADWKVPEGKTSDSAKMRVSQEFSKTEPDLFGLTDDTYATNYSPNAEYSLSFGEEGDINEWDMVSKSHFLKYNLNSRNQFVSPIDIKYITDDKFAVIYSVGNFDSLAVFERENTEPVYKERMTEYKPSELFYLDGENEFIILPQEANYFQVIDTDDYSVNRDVVFNHPITAISIAKDTNLIAVSRLDSRIMILNKDSYEVQDSKYYFGTRIIDELSISPNGEYLAYIVKTSTMGTASFIYDNSTDFLLSYLFLNNFTPAVNVGFSPTSNMVIFTFQYGKQINVYDMLTQRVVGNIQINNEVTDMDYSTENNTILITARGESSNIKFQQRSFTYPETDESDSVFSIVYPEFDKEAFEFGDEYIYHDKQSSFSVEFCNTSKVPLFVEDLFFENNIHFSIDNYPLPDTILPGDCIDISLIFNPKDTGAVSDNLILESCGMEYPITLNGNGLNRNIEILTEQIDFGDVCLQDTSTITLDIFRNSDPVPLYFNNFRVEDEYSDIFQFVDYSQDTLIEPGGKLSATVRVIPDELGEHIANYEVLHNDQEKYTASAKLRVRGIGTFVELSHTVLPFIPEQRIRTLKVKNKGEDPFTIDEAFLTPDTEFEILTPMPITVMPNDSVEIEIEWIGNGENISANLELVATPCLTQRYIELTDYQAESNLTINDTQTEPTDTAAITISYQNQENAEYAGERFFEAYLTIKSDLFLPEYAVSDFGDAVVENVGENGNGERIFKIRIEGDFKESGELVKIVGYPGLSEINESVVKFDSERSIFWGESTQESSRSGLFTVLLNCNDQTLRKLDESEIQSISPNPASNEAYIQISTSENINTDFQIINESGKSVFEQNLSLKKGLNLVNLNTSNISPGSYNISIESKFGVSSKKLIIIR